MHAHICVGVCEGQKTVLTLLGLESQVVVTHPVELGTAVWTSATAASVLTAGHFPSPFITTFWSKVCPLFRSRRMALKQLWWKLTGLTGCSMESLLFLCYCSNDRHQPRGRRDT